MDGSGQTLYIPNPQDPGDVLAKKKIRKNSKIGEIIQKNVFRVKKTTRGMDGSGQTLYIRNPQDPGNVLAKKNSKKVQKRGDNSKKCVQSQKNDTWTDRPGSAGSFR